jgi:hypothetical protein
MPIPINTTEWMSPYLVGLPRTNNAIFTQVWEHNRFSFRDQVSNADEVDLWSARLVCAAMHMSQRLLIVLPDHAPHRPALLFASCVVMDALDTIAYPDIEPNRVVYFGTRIGIREQLGSVKIQDLALDSVFPAYRTSRTTGTSIPLKRKRSHRTSLTMASALPQVICAYSPADPCKVIDQFEPTWLAVDCSDASSIRWLPSLLNYAQQLDLPVVAWSQNSLATTVHDFSQNGGSVFRWPRGRLHSYGDVLNDDPACHSRTMITPVLVNSEIPRFIDNLRIAYYKLAEVTKYSNPKDRLLFDTINVGWRYLQSIELLPVPLSLYEAEVSRFWGITPIGNLQQLFLRFIEAAKNVYAHAIPAMQEAHDALMANHALLRDNEPPLWTMLTAECLSAGADSKPRFLVFTSEYRKQLFAFGLLSRYNLTTLDLQHRGIWLTTLKELYREVVHREGSMQSGEGSLNTIPLSLPIDKDYSLLLVGIPNARQSGYIEALLDCDKCQFAIYPYQTMALKRRVDEWDTALALNPQEQTICLDRLSIRPIHLNKVPPKGSYIAILDTENLTVAAKNVLHPRPIPSWQALDPIEELSFLFEPEEEQGFEDDNAVKYPKVRDGDDQTEDSWVESVLEFGLEGGWNVTFAADEKIQVIEGTEDAHAVERYVQSIRLQDRLLFIVGHRRQNLYDLIIERVHSHPAIELHLSMIRRWHQELSIAYDTWKRDYTRGLDDLLMELRIRGSNITTTQSLRLWLTGEVICPEDSNDLQRVADILDISFVSDNYRHIGKAAQRLRNIHRALARRLNRWLQQDAAGSLREGKPDTSILDKELGLTFNDFRDSLLILRVEVILPKQGLYLRSGLGQLEKGILI